MAEWKKVFSVTIPAADMIPTASAPDVDDTGPELVVASAGDWTLTMNGSAAALLADTVAEAICDMSESCLRYDPHGIRDDYGAVRRNVDSLRTILRALPVGGEWRSALAIAEAALRPRPFKA